MPNKTRRRRKCTKLRRKVRRSRRRSRKLFNKLKRSRRKRHKLISYNIEDPYYCNIFMSIDVAKRREKGLSIPRNPKNLLDFNNCDDIRKCFPIHDLKYSGNDLTYKNIRLTKVGNDRFILRGGFGSVYKRRYRRSDNAGNIELAIKTPNAGQTGDLDEWTVRDKLRDISKCTCFIPIKPLRRDLIVMPLMEGSVGDFSKNHIYFTNDYHVSTFLYTVIKSFNCIFKKGLFYQDIKPGNILYKVYNDKKVQLFIGDVGSIDPSGGCYVATPFYLPGFVQQGNSYNCGNDINRHRTVMIFQVLRTMQELLLNQTTAETTTINTEDVKDFVMVYLAIITNNLTSAYDNPNDQYLQYNYQVSTLYKQINTVTQRPGQTDEQYYGIENIKNIINPFRKYKKNDYERQKDDNLVYNIFDTISGEQTVTIPDDSVERYKSNPQTIDPEQFTKLGSDTWINTILRDSDRGAFNDRRRRLRQQAGGGVQQQPQPQPQQLGGGLIVPQFGAPQQPQQLGGGLIVPQFGAPQPQFGLPQPIQRPAFIQPANPQFFQPQQIVQPFQPQIVQPFQPQLQKDDYDMLSYLENQGFFIINQTPFNQLWRVGPFGEHLRILLPAKEEWIHNNEASFRAQGVNYDVARTLSEYLIRSASRGISIFG